MAQQNGRFITFEGIEGSGKSTQQQRLAAWLQAQGHTVHATKQPGGTDIGQKIRQIVLHKDHDNMAPACEALLYLADRAQHHHEMIVPTLEQGHWVICDRYHDSTMAYQGAARGIDAAHLNQMFKVATGGLKPQLTLLLDMDAEAGLQRARHRNQEEKLETLEGRFEAEALQFHQRVRAAFLAQARAEPHRYVVIQANRDPEAVAQDCRAAVAAKWNLDHV